VCMCVCVCVRACVRACSDVCASAHEVQVCVCLCVRTHPVWNLRLDLLVLVHSSITTASSSSTTTAAASTTTTFSSSTYSHSSLHLPCCLGCLGVFKSGLAQARALSFAHSPRPNSRQATHNSRATLRHAHRVRWGSSRHTSATHSAHAAPTTPTPPSPPPEQAWVLPPLTPASAWLGTQQEPGARLARRRRRKGGEGGGRGRRAPGWQGVSLVRRGHTSLNWGWTRVHPARGARSWHAQARVIVAVMIGSWGNRYYRLLACGAC